MFILRILNVKLLSGENIVFCLVMMEKYFRKHEPYDHILR